MSFPFHSSRSSNSSASDARLSGASQRRRGGCIPDGIGGPRLGSSPAQCPGPQFGPSPKIPPVFQEEPFLQS